jgi:hypothetical protein
LFRYGHTHCASFPESQPLHCALESILWALAWPFARRTQPLLVSVAHSHFDHL